MALLRRTPRPISWLRLDFGRDLDPAAVRSFMLSLVSNPSLGTVVFETESEGGTISYRLGTYFSERVQTAAEAMLPGTIVLPTERSLPERGRAGLVRINTRRRPVNTDDPEGFAARLLGAIRGRSDAAVIHQLIVGRRLRPNAVPARIDGLGAETWLGAIADAAAGGGARPDGEARQALANKEALPGAEVNLRLLVTEESADQFDRRYEAACRSVETPGVRLRLARESWRSARSARPSRKAVPLNLYELITLVAWPLGERSYPGLDRSGPRLLAPTQAEQAQRVVGVAAHPGREIRLGLAPADGLRHLHTIGPTGVGKSTLLLNLIVQDINDGRGVIVLDPKGDLIDDVLARAPAGAIERLAVLDAANPEAMVGFNPLSIDPVEREMAVDGVLHVFRQLHSDSWGPRTQDILHSALLTLVHSPEHATIILIPQLLIDGRFRQRLLAGLQLPSSVRLFWRWFDGLSDAERNSVIAPLMNKLRPFTLRSSLRGLLGQPGPLFDPQTVFTRGHVLLVPLRSGVIGAEAANLLGSLVVARTWQLAQQRTSIPAEQRTPVFLYLDEFQQYLHLPTDLADVLAQARGLGLGLVMAHQHIGQLSPHVRATVLANAQSRICFRLSDEDANTIARATTELDRFDLARLGNYEIYASLLTNGARTPYASARTLAPGPALRDPRALASRLAERWGRPLTEIDEQLSKADGQSDDGAGIGRRRRGGS